MHFFLEDFFFCFFSDSILCWRLTIGPSVASSSRGRVINIFVRNDSDILYAPDEGNNSVWPLVRHHQEEKKRTLWPKRVNRNAVAAATLAFVFFLVNLDSCWQKPKNLSYFHCQTILSVCDHQWSWFEDISNISKLTFDVEENWHWKLMMGRVWENAKKTFTRSYFLTIFCVSISIYCPLCFGS